MILLVDTREQLPYWQGAECGRLCLCVGDYTTAALLNKFHIERKSPEDLYGSITKGNHRFKKEFIKAHKRKIGLAVYVESTKSDFIAKLFPRGDDRLVKSETLAKIVATLERKYFVEFVWCGDREKAQKKVFTRLKSEEDDRQRTKRNAGKKAFKN